jgi:oligoribonuclease NrnB/cAMP/cGMP phosphodiesterase (DHH superfamily)
VLGCIQGIRQEGISGAALTYMYLYKKEFAEIPYYVKLVSDYDCWQFKYDPDTTYFKLGLEADIYDALDKVWVELADYDNLYRLSGGFSKSMPLPQTVNGKIIKKYIAADNKLYRDCYAYEAEIAGYTALVVNKKSNSWIFGEKYNEYPLVCIWVFDGKVYTYSIFSGDSTVNCSEIAESFGGGGHKGAAGFSSKELLFKAK